MPYTGTEQVMPYTRTAQNCIGSTTIHCGVGWTMVEGKSAAVRLGMQSDESQGYTTNLPMPNTFAEEALHQVSCLS